MSEIPTPKASVLANPTTQAIAAVLLLAVGGGTGSLATNRGPIELAQADRLLLTNLRDDLVKLKADADSKRAVFDYRLKAVEEKKCP